MVSLPQPPVTVSVPLSQSFNSASTPPYGIVSSYVVAGIGMAKSQSRPLRENDSAPSPEPYE